jgi:hypothetical protein
LSQYRDVLIERLAKLDDLRETGAIPAGAYQAKRMELKNQLASLIIRLGEGSRERTQTERSERSHA